MREWEKANKIFINLHYDKFVFNQLFPASQLQFAYKFIKIHLIVGKVTTGGVAVSVQVTMSYGYNIDTRH